MSNAPAVSSDTASPTGGLARAFQPGQRLLARLRLSGQLSLLGGLLLATLGSSVAAGVKLSLDQEAPALLGLSLGLVSGLLYLGAAFVSLMQQGTATAAAGLQALLAGDLTRINPSAGGHEMGQINSHINGTSLRLSRMVARVRNEAELVAMASERLSEQAEGLSSRTSAQRERLAQQADGVDNLLQVVRATGEELTQANLRSASVREAAEAGANVVGRAVQVMQGLQDGARQMTDIIATIDGIAFQTNILALNAAVEAARAGESGRGFAVVASEVRSLAGRSATAAAEVRRLIQTSAQGIGDSAQQIAASRDALMQVFSGIQEVSERIGTVAAASSMQTEALDEISARVREVDQLSDDNARMVEVAVHSATRLRQQARTLSSAVGHERLRQGTADEARQLVQKAQALVRSAGRAAAVRAIHDPAGGFRDRDLFIIVLDRQGYFRAFGLDPSKADKPSVAAPGVDIDALNRATWERADHGGGWIEFRASHPLTKLPCDKMAYVLPADAEWIVLCSINKNDGTPDDVPNRSPVAAVA